MLKKEIEKVTKNMASLLIYKNEKYGNSALEPLQIFSKAEPKQQIKNRLDDKLGRIQVSEEPRKNDVADLIGYLNLLCIENGWLDFEEFKD